MYLKVLWERGHSNLFKVENDAVVFNCFQTVTSIPVGGFYCHGDQVLITNVHRVDEETTEWNATVPFGEVALLNWLDQWNVQIISTPFGPLEISSEWIGGGDSCYQGYAITPFGEELHLEKPDDSVFVSIKQAWENAGDFFVGDTYKEVWFKSE